MQAAFDWFSGRRQRSQACPTALPKALRYNRTSANGHLSTLPTSLQWPLLGGQSIH